MFNAANEVAVATFLAGGLSFLGIFETIETVLGRHGLVQNPSLDDILSADSWAREEAGAVVG